MASNQRRIERELQWLAEKLGQASSGPLQADTKLARETRLRKSATTEGLIDVYCSHYRDAPSPEFARDIDAACNYPVQVIIPIHGPREHAKTTRMRLNRLRQILHFDLKYRLFISRVQNRAWDQIEMIHYELTNNSRILADYEVTVFMFNKTEGIFSARIIRKLDGKRHMFRLQAGSYQTDSKGFLWHGVRPQGADVDDLDNLRSAQNPDINKTKVSFIVQDLLPACTGPVVWFCNIGTKNSSAYMLFVEAFSNEEEIFRDWVKNGGSVPGEFADLCARNGGRLPDADELSDISSVIIPLVFRAETILEDGSTRYLWPERYAPEWYRRKKLILGYRYDGEFNGFPIAPGKIFKPEFFEKRWTDLPSGPNVVWFSWLDPGWGTTRHSAYKCLMVGCCDGKHVYIVDAYCRQGEPVVNVLYAWYRFFETYPMMRSGSYENEFAQKNHMRPHLKLAELEKKKPLPVIAEDNPGEKYSRIESQLPYHETDRVLWPPTFSSDMKAVKDMYLEYPDGKFVDAPDCGQALISRLFERYSSRTSHSESWNLRRIIHQTVKRYV